MFADQVVWVTGASSGIGEGMCKAFASLGAAVVLSARNVDELQRVKSECVAGGADEDRLMVQPLDIVDFPAVQEAVEAVVDRFSCIDVLMNNAGLGARDLCLNIDLEVYRRVMDVNLFGTIALTKAVLPVMMEQRSGRSSLPSTRAARREHHRTFPAHTEGRDCG